MPYRYQSYPHVNFISSSFFFFSDSHIYIHSSLTLMKYYISRFDDIKYRLVFLTPVLFITSKYSHSGSCPYFNLATRLDFRKKQQGKSEPDTDILEIIICTERMPISKHLLCLICLAGNLVMKYNRIYSIL